MAEAIFALVRFSNNIHAYNGVCTWKDRLRWRLDLIRAFESVKELKISSVCGAAEAPAMIKGRRLGWRAIDHMGKRWCVWDWVKALTISTSAWYSSTCLSLLKSHSCSLKFAKIPWTLLLSIPDEWYTHCWEWFGVSTPTDKGKQ